MKFTYINESHGFINKEDIVLGEKYDISAIVEQMLNIRSARDFLDFILALPCSFCEKFFFDMEDIEEGIEDLLPYNEAHMYSGDFQKTVQRHFLEMDYLDEFMIREGVFGPLVLKEYSTHEIEEVACNGDYVSIYLSSIESLIKNVQALATLAALATRPDVDSYFKRESRRPSDSVQIVKSGLAAGTDFHSDSEKDSPLLALFDETEINDVKEIADYLGYEFRYMDVHQRDYIDKPFAVKKEMSDSSIAAFIFSWFMNTLFEGTAESYYSGNTFKVTFDDGKFSIQDAHSPIRDLYHETSKLAESGAFKLCARCGKGFIDNKSRGNEALYCSRSCNTQASNKRKDRAKQYQAAGIPIEKAIEQIGAKYEKSIREWYAISVSD